MLNLTMSVFQQVFRKLDPNKSGVVNLNDIKKFYCTKKHPKVISGDKVIKFNKFAGINIFWVLLRVTLAQAIRKINCHTKLLTLMKA